MKAVSLIFVINVMSCMRFFKMSNVIPDQIKNYENDIKEYTNNPNQYITTHSNKDIFITIFSNYTRLDGLQLYRNFINSDRRNDMQFKIDKINNINSRNVDKWQYDSIIKKFRLSEDINSYSNYYKWKLIIELLNSIDNVPTDFRSNKNNNKLLFPEEINIISPPDI